MSATIQSLCCCKPFWKLFCHGRVMHNFLTLGVVCFHVMSIFRSHVAQNAVRDLRSVIFSSDAFILLCVSHYLFYSTVWKSKIKTKKSTLQVKRPCLKSQGWHSKNTWSTIPTCTAWCSEIGSLTSLDAWTSGASSDAREPVSLPQAVYTVNQFAGLSVSRFFSFIFASYQLVMSDSRG